MHITDLMLPVWRRRATLDADAACTIDGLFGDVFSSVVFRFHYIKIEIIRVHFTRVYRMVNKILVLHTQVLSYGRIGITKVQTQLI